MEGVPTADAAAANNGVAAAAWRDRACGHVRAANVWRVCLRGRAHRANAGACHSGAGACYYASGARCDIRICGGYILDAPRKPTAGHKCIASSKPTTGRMRFKPASGTKPIASV